MGSRLLHSSRPRSPRKLLANQIRNVIEADRVIIDFFLYILFCYFLLSLHLVDGKMSDREGLAQLLRVEKGQD